jgi:hypothetical protein
LVGDPRDRKAYAIAIAMLGLAFVLAVAGVCWIVAEHESLDKSEEIWFLPAAIGSVFVGTLIPSFACKWLAALAVAAGVAGAFEDEYRIALWVLGTVLGGVFLGLFIPSPCRRER